MHIDFDSFFRNRVESMMITASWVAEVQSILGLKGASQVWSGRAEWNFWLHGAPGVYALAFSDGDPVQWMEQCLYEGRFLLKCYPYPDHPSFAGFSGVERSLVKSDRFDPTNTPRFETAAEIPDSLFTIGSLSILLDPEDRLTLLTFESLDGLKTTACGTPSIDPAREVVLRDVAGWRIGYPLFELMVGLFSYHRREAPVFLGATRSPGFEYALSPDGSLGCRTDQRISRRSLTLGFHRDRREAHWIESLWQVGLEEGEAPIETLKLPYSREEVHPSIHSEYPAPNPRWWEMAYSHFRSELTSTCGCGDHDCQHDHEGRPGCGLGPLSQRVRPRVRAD